MSEKPFGVVATDDAPNTVESRFTLEEIDSLSMVLMRELRDDDHFYNPGYKIGYRLALEKLRRRLLKLQESRR